MRGQHNFCLKSRTRFTPKTWMVRRRNNTTQILCFERLWNWRIEFALGIGLPHSKTWVPKWRIATKKKQTLWTSCRCCKSCSPNALLHQTSISRSDRTFWVCPNNSKWTGRSQRTLAKTCFWNWKKRNAHSSRRKPVGRKFHPPRQIRSSDGLQTLNASEPGPNCCLCDCCAKCRRHRPLQPNAKHWRKSYRKWTRKDEPDRANRHGPTHSIGAVEPTSTVGVTGLEPVASTV